MSRPRHSARPPGRVGARGSLPFDAQGMLLDELNKSIPQLLKVWQSAPIDARKHLLPICQCAELLTYTTETQKALRSGVLHGLQKEWLEKTAQRCRLWLESHIS